MAYSDKVLDHYENPRNVGSFAKNIVLSDADLSSRQPAFDRYGPSWPEERRDYGQEHEADGHHVETLRPGQPRNYPQCQARQQDGSASAHQVLSATGTGTSSRSREMIAATLLPLMAASAVMITRWQRTAGPRWKDLRGNAG